MSEKKKFPLGAWEGEVSSIAPGSVIVNVRITRTVVDNVRLDTSKGVFIDPPLWDNGRPSEHEMRDLLEHVRFLKMSEEERAAYEERQKLIRERDALQLEVSHLRWQLQNQKATPILRSTDEECRGGCSRGGDGPACGKRGCRG